MTNVLIVILYVVIFLSFVSITKYLKGFTVLPNTIFTFVWSFVAILSIVNNVGIIKPSFTIHFYIFTSIFTFNLIYLLFSPMKKNNGIELNLKQTNFEDKYKINYKLVYFIVFLSMCFMSVHIITAFTTILQYGFDMTLVRTINFSKVENSTSMLFGFLTRSVPVAVVTAVSILGSINMNLRNRKLVILSITMVLLYTFAFGGRYQLLNFIFFYLASFLILNNRKNFKIKIKKRYIISLVTVIVIMTTLRGSELNELFEMIILYFVGSLSFLEVIINNPDNFGLSNGYMFGYLTFGFLLEPFILALKLFFGSSLDIPSYYFNIHAQTFYDIGTYAPIYFNNNTTMFYNFIYDFGVFGPLIGTLIIVSLICFFEIRFKKYNSYRALIYLVYFYSVILNSTMMYTITNINSSLIIFFIYIFIKRRRA
ncbi:hypothetical protein UACE39S_01439 [Ureibacillus acetophenoni]